MCEYYLSTSKYKVRHFSTIFEALRDIIDLKVPAIWRAQICGATHIVGTHATPINILFSGPNPRPSPQRSLMRLRDSVVAHTREIVWRSAAVQSLPPDSFEADAAASRVRELLLQAHRLGFEVRLPSTPTPCHVTLHRLPYTPHVRVVHSCTKSSTNLHKHPSSCKRRSSPKNDPFPSSRSGRKRPTREDGGPRP